VSKMDYPDLEPSWAPKKCQDCGKELVPGDEIVRTTEGRDWWWHRACFDANTKPFSVRLVATDGRLTKPSS
jgi:hypothetical protein